MRSPTLESLRRQLKSAGDLGSVVNTMKALAASSVGQYASAVQALDDYLAGVRLGLSTCLRETPVSPPIVARRAEPVVALIVFGSDQGLVGSFNSALSEYVIDSVSDLVARTEVWAVGERVAAQLEAGGLEVVRVLSVPGSVKAITALVGEIEVGQEGGRGLPDYAEVQVFHNRMVSAQTYESVSMRLLPFDETWRQDLLQLEWPTSGHPEMIDSGSWALSALVREYLFVSLFRASAESLMSENTSRLRAMQRAEENIEERVGELTRTYQSLRQRQIDEELFDVVSGYESLPSGSKRGVK